MRLQLPPMFAVLCLLHSGYSEAAPQAITLGVHPYLTAIELEKRFAPLANHLSDELGQFVHVRVSPSYETHIDRVVESKIDIAYMGPSMFVKAQEDSSDLIPIARLEVKGQPVFRGKIITREDSSIMGLSDLKGKRFAFGNKDSTMSHLVPRYELMQAGILEQLAHYSFLGAHNNVALGVLLGKYDAGAVKEGVFMKYKERGLRLIYDTMPVSEHLFICTKKVSSEVCEKIKKSLLSLKSGAEKPDVLKSIKPTITGLVSVKTNDSDNLKLIMNELK